MANRVPMRHIPEPTTGPVGPSPASDSHKAGNIVTLTVKEREALLRVASPANGLASVAHKLRRDDVPSLKAEVTRLKAEATRSDSAFSALKQQHTAADVALVDAKAEIESLTGQLQAAQATIAEALKQVRREGFTDVDGVAWIEHGPVEHILSRADTSTLAAVKAEALREAADYLAQPYHLWHGDSGVTVEEYDEQPSLKRPKLVDWLRNRSAPVTPTENGENN